MTTELILGLISGVLIGMVYGLVGAGLNIIFGVVRVLNVAHGEFLMLAAFNTYWLNALWGIDPLVLLLVNGPLFFVIGMLMYYVTVPRLLQSEDPETASFLSYFGMSLLISGAVFVTLGASHRAVPYPYNIVSISLGNIYLPMGRLIAFFVASVVSLALLFFLYRTYLGKAMRAAIQNREALQLLGVNTHRVSAIAFGVGISLSAVSGNVIVLVFPPILHTMGLDYTFIAFTVIILGGLGNPLGAIIGGVIFGVIQSVSMVYLPPATSSIITFLIIICLIMTKPQGLLTGK